MYIFRGGAVSKRIIVNKWCFYIRVIKVWDINILTVVLSFCPAIILYAYDYFMKKIISMCFVQIYNLYSLESREPICYIWICLFLSVFV